MDERRTEHLLARLWREIPAPSEDELEAIGRRARAEANVVEAAPARTMRPNGRRLRLRWAVAAAACTLLVGSALGFGLASSLTPSGSAGVNFVGFGFRPLQGWNVIQTGTLDESGVATAVAANVPLRASDGLDGLPRTTLRSLPPQGALIFATFSLRGDPDKDFDYTARSFPLRLDDAERVPSTAGSLGNLARYHLRAGAGGYNVDVNVYFGEPEPLAQAFVAAQAQLSRLVVASERVTIRVRPAVATRSPVTVFGTANGGHAGESVSIQGKVCGTPFFRVVAGATIEEGGRWSTLYYPYTLTTLRAVWRDETSAEVTIRRYATIRIRKRSSRTIEVDAIGKSSFWRKRATIQRFDNRLGRWSTVRFVVLADSFGPPPGTLGGRGARATFTLPVPRGTLIRAVFPRLQAGPCYLAGVSNSLRT